MKRIFALAALAAAACLSAGTAFAQETKVAIGISGWTGFAPLTLAKEAGLYKKHGLDVSIRKIPQKDRHLAIASGDIQCAATTVETWIVWNANGVATTQIFQLDKSFGADGIGVSDSVISVEPSGYRGIESVIEPDASSASYPLAAAAITGGRVRVPGLTRDSWQGDVAIVDILGAMGCRTAFDADGAEVEGGPLRGIELDMSDVSDLVPTVAAVACFADSPTTITGVGFIRRKESDRIGDLVAGLVDVGCRAIALDDGLRIEPTSPTDRHGATLRTHHDHRLAMAWSLLALRIASVSIDDPSVVAKSWPTWWDVRSALLASAIR